MTKLTLATPNDCINQIVEGYNIIQKGYGIANDAIAAYLQMDGCTIATLHQDLREAGCEISKKTLYNRQSQLRGQGKLPPADDRYRRDANGGDSRAGNGSSTINTKVDWIDLAKSMAWMPQYEQLTEQVWGDILDDHKLNRGIPALQLLGEIIVEQQVPITKPNTLSALLPCLTAFNAWMLAKEAVHNAVILIANTATDDGDVSLTQMQTVRQMLLP